MTYFTEEQVSLLLKPIHPNRVLQRDGMSYVEGYDICAELNRVFGFGRWDVEVLDQVLLREAEVKTKAYTDRQGNEKGGKPAWYVVYRSRLRLTVKAPDGTPLSVQEATHVGESTHPVYGEAHGNAVTNSETYALKRCAKNFGDQFGLSLYNKGSVQPLVRWTLVRPTAAETPADTDDVPQVAAENDGRHAADMLAPEDAWLTRIEAVDSIPDADIVLADLRKLGQDGEITAERAAQVRTALDARVAEIRAREARPARPAQSGGKVNSARPSGNGATPKSDDSLPDEAEWVRDFTTRLGKAQADRELLGLRTELLKAVTGGKIAPPTGNELIDDLNKRREALAGAAA